MAEDKPLLAPSGMVDQNSGPAFEQGQVDRPPPPSETQLKLRPSPTLHLRALVATICFFGGIAAGLYFRFAGSEPNMTGMTICLVVGSLIYVIEALSSETCTFLRRIESAEGADKFLSRLKEAQPALTFHVTAYHYETRYRTVTSTDAQGRQTTRQESYQERVTTYVGSEPYAIFSWRDISSPTGGLDVYQLTKLRLRKYVVFHDADSRQHFQAAFDRFRMLNGSRDVHTDMRWDFSVPGFQTSILAHARQLPWFVSMGHFLGATLLGMSYPYRRAMSSISMDADFTLLKEVSATTRLPPIKAHQNLPHGSQSHPPSSHPSHAPASAPPPPTTDGYFPSEAYITELFPEEVAGAVPPPVHEDSGIIESEYHRASAPPLPSHESEPESYI